MTVYMKFFRRVNCRSQTISWPLSVTRSNLGIPYWYCDVVGQYSVRYAFPIDYVIRPFCLILMWRLVNENHTLLPSTERPSRLESRNSTSCKGLFMACRWSIVAIWSVVVKYASSTLFVVTYVALCLPVFQTEIFSLVSLMLVRIVPISFQMLQLNWRVSPIYQQVEYTHWILWKGIAFVLIL